MGKSSKTQSSKQTAELTHFVEPAAGDKVNLNIPPARLLQVYAFDPSLDLDLQTMSVNRSVVRIKWEDVAPGPVGEYVEVVDVDPASQSVYPPVDLNAAELLAQDGLPPSEGSPQFHQQMVYAVAMMTIANFEEALGRRIHWSPRDQDGDGKALDAPNAYVPRLRIYPHAVRDANAYYSPTKRALLFGYFNAANADAREGYPGGMVFTALSHDVIAHEVTHAILDGIHPRLLDVTNPDVLAFHEGFADIVAIFQHFTLPGILEHQIANTRGDLEAENLLAKLAIQFGRATQRGNALRDALGQTDPATGRWQRKEIDPEHFEQTDMPHARGALLVAAIFDAFLAIYGRHTADLRRIASSGSGILPQGALHPDLVNRFADEARRAAKRILTICIRALDFLPPVDVTFGDYARALITSDQEAFPNDQRHYRVAIVRALRDRGIFPRDVRTLSVDSLCWQLPSSDEQELAATWFPSKDVLWFMTHSLAYNEGLEELVHTLQAKSISEKSKPEHREAIRSAYMKYLSGLHDGALNGKPHDPRSRAAEFLRERNFAQLVKLHVTFSVFANWESITEQAKKFRWVFGLDIGGADDSEEQESEWLKSMEDFGRRLNIDDGILETARALVESSGQALKIGQSLARIDVHAVRPVLRLSSDGGLRPELLVMVTQRRAHEVKIDSRTYQYWFQGGCTLVIDPEQGRIRYSISKDIGSETRRERQESFYRRRIQQEGHSAAARYGLSEKTPGKSDKLGNAEPPREPFAIVHGGGALGEWS